MEHNNLFDALMADDDNGNQTVQQPPSAAQAADTNPAGPTADAAATPARFAAVNFAALEPTPPAAATAARFAPVNFGGQGAARALEIYQTANNCPVLLNYQVVTPYQLDDEQVLEQAAAHGLEGAQFAEIDLLGQLMSKLTKEEAHLALPAAQRTERTGQPHEPPPHSIASLYRVVMDTPSYSIVALTSGPQSSALKQWAKGPLRLLGPNGKVLYANPTAPEAGNPVNIYIAQVLHVEHRHLDELITAIQLHLNSQHVGVVYSVAGYIAADVDQGPAEDARTTANLLIIPTCFKADGQEDAELAVWAAQAAKPVWAPGAPGEHRLAV